LCAFQCARWHCTLQYQTRLHRLQMAAASLTALHDAHACACFGSLVDMAASEVRLV